MIYSLLIVKLMPDGVNRIERTLSGLPPEHYEQQLQPGEVGYIIDGGLGVIHDEMLCVVNHVLVRLPLWNGLTDGNGNPVAIQNEGLYLGVEMIRGPALH